MSHTLKYSYTLLAPIYDAIVDSPTRATRHQSLTQLNDVTAQTILLCGVGSGLDFPHLPLGANYVGIDLTPAMLKRAHQRLTPRLSTKLHQGDVMQLPYPNACYDQIIMHLILSVVPEPQRALNEAMRVVKAGGKIIILDKFLRAGQHAPIRRLINPLISKIATRTDVVFESLQRPVEVTLLSDKPALLNGWFRYIVLEKTVVHNDISTNE
ncbi:class I SAM-dependent methyltransferase [Beggiatoa leptomitoformis]|uniref:Methyltransferase domain-containing protein n=1 Tax=Beggiatoa leptomitoformis TaxID=288004 RepID=A0A2N9YBU5_9GAMM|nr:class I SAM-dependent methyltransferase [Beggiatoa leptomitoformis]ALG66790.1 methyltransferase domain-containing protein [Beggiatoa leptomitoformis]AUI67864.1 methyltransferase domain-containing protein [Beggiatoa leptomitoformis]